jgi:NADH:ubiquinone oxidoreductase subunit H
LTQDIKAHPIHYAFLGGWLSLGLMLLTMAKYNSQLQMKTMVLMAMGYIVWGIIHHYRLRDLTAKIVLEYILVATLVMIIVCALLTQL